MPSPATTLVLALEVVLVTTYLALGFAARRHFDADRLADLNMTEANLFWYPFAWPAYDVYAPSARKLRVAGSIVVGLAVVAPAAVLSLWNSVRVAT